MKSLLSWSATLSLLGSSVFVSLFGWRSPAVSIPDEAIIEKLQYVPVYTILDRRFKFIQTGSNNSQGGKIDLFFRSEDALRALESLQIKDPARAREWQVVPVTLGSIYKLLGENKTRQDSLSFVLNPDQQEVRTAINMVRERGWVYERGVPLFFATLGESGNIIPMEHNGRNVYPLFFQRQQLLEMVERFMEKHPDLASSVNTKVVSLEWLMEQWQTSDDKGLEGIILIVSEESQAVLRELGAGQ